LGEGKKGGERPLVVVIHGALKQERKNSCGTRLTEHSKPERKNAEKKKTMGRRLAAQKGRGGGANETVAERVAKKKTNQQGGLRSAKPW